MGDFPVMLTVEGGEESIANSIPNLLQCSADGLVETLFVAKLVE
jgi:hypothetical protein